MARIEIPLYSPQSIPTGTELAVIETGRGSIRVELFGLEVPQTVANFMELAESGFYNGLKFHGYKQDSVVAGGCPVTRELGSAQVFAAVRGTLHGIHPGTGNAGYRIVDEWQDNPKNLHLDGSIVMAHNSEPDSGSCQFYFSLAKQPELDNRFTVFGQTSSESLAVVHALRIGDVIESIRIEC